MGNDKYKFNPFTGNLDMTVDAQGIEEDVQKDIEQHNTSENAHQDIRSDIQLLKETQADLNQNDDTQYDYVKNRSHYEYYQELLKYDLGEGAFDGSTSYSIPFEGNLFGKKIYAVINGTRYEAVLSGMKPDGTGGGGSWIIADVLYAGLSFGGNRFYVSGKCFLENVESAYFVVEQKAYKMLDANFLSNGTDYIYVDKTNGNDNNNGFKSSPVKTLRKALELSNANGNKYIRFAETDIYVNNAQSGTEYAYVEGQPMRVWIDKGQTLYLNSYYNVYAEFKVRGDGNVSAGSPVVPMGVDIDIDVAGNATFSYPVYAVGTDTYKTLLGDTLRVKARQITLYCTNTINTVTNNPTDNYTTYTNNIDLNAEEVYFYGNLDYIQIVPKLSIAAKKLTNYATVFKADELQISVDKFINYSTPSSGGVFMIGTAWIDGSAEVSPDISNVFIKTLVSCTFDVSVTTTTTLFCPSFYSANQKYRLHLHVGTFDLSSLKTNEGAYPLRLYNLSSPNFDISGICEHIDFNSGSVAEIYPWDMVQNYYGTQSSDWQDNFQPRDEFIWLDRPDSIFDFYYQEDSPAGNNGRTPQHPCGNMTELYTVVSRFAPNKGSTPIIRLHVMNGGKTGDLLNGRQNTSIKNVIKYSTSGSYSTTTLQPDGIELDFGYWNYKNMSPSIEIVAETEMMKLYVKNLTSGDFCKIHGFDNVFLDTCTLRNAQLSCVYEMTIYNSSMGGGGHAEIRAGKFNAYRSEFGGITSIEADYVEYLDFLYRQADYFNFNCISHSNIGVCALNYSTTAPTTGVINISAANTANVIRFLKCNTLLVNVQADTLYYLHGTYITGGRTTLKASYLSVGHVGDYCDQVVGVDFYAEADNVNWNNPFNIQSSRVCIKASKYASGKLEMNSSAVVDIDAPEVNFTAQSIGTYGGMALSIRGDYVYLAPVSGQTVQLGYLCIDAARLNVSAGLIYRCNILANEYSGTIVLSDWLADDNDTIDKLPVNVFKIGHFMQLSPNTPAVATVSQKNIGINLVFDYETATYEGQEITDIITTSGNDNIMNSYSATTSEIDDIMN